MLARQARNSPAGEVSLMHAFLGFAHTMEDTTRQQRAWRSAARVDGII
jgi:hypothetical protein